MLLTSALTLTLAFAQTGEPAPVTVVGPVELTPSAAVAAARVSAADEFAWELERRGRGVVDRVRPIWLPDFVAESSFRRWLRTIQPESGLAILGQETRTHDHGNYVSYQAALTVAPDEAWTTSALGELRGTIERSAQHFVIASGGAVGLWGLLAFLYVWLDRVSRGYMSWRLRILFGGMGLALPGIALALV